MIRIITGKVDSGKTTKLLSVYNDSKTGDGFIIKKIYGDGVHIGQEVMRLSTGECKLFSLKKSYLPQDWDEAYCYGPYSFSGQGLFFANRIIMDGLQMKMESLYIDEVGPLELQEKGFFEITCLALASRKTVYLTIRESCFFAVIQKFKISDFHKIGV